METDKKHAPKYVTNFKKFLGFPNYVKRFIPNYSTLNTLTHPFRELLQKEGDFNWTETCHEAFEKLKLFMNSDTCLSYFDESVFRV